MFKFQRIISAGLKWTDNLFVEEEFIGTMGFDEEGLWIKIKRNLTLQEINLLIAQMLISNPDLVTEKIEMMKYE
ncbi:hypothetical protein CVD28_03650 [Bacillus sp. M6-12]|uniref:hypothetical protein n=1 Tax=Bacillus sp. M6-12 TaxID=2054166 RepID=UPI000C77C152|nr:hypothetical protein [Bacillus sp. M6-12]PLS19522.1 hypothetical protein CVD28_03650 [Bacillus sp. M6-12]